MGDIKGTIKGGVLAAIVVYGALCREVPPHKEGNMATFSAEDRRKTQGYRLTAAPHALAEASRQTTSAMVGVKFTDRDAIRGMDILLQYGRARAYPGFVYVLSQQMADRAIPALRKAGVLYLRRDDLPLKLTGAMARELKDGIWQKDKD